MSDKRIVGSLFGQIWLFNSGRLKVHGNTRQFRYRPRPNENCRLRIRWASSMPANVMAALPNDLKPPIEAHRRLTAR